MNMNESPEEARVRYAKMKKGEIIEKTNDFYVGYFLAMALENWNINFKTEFNIDDDDGMPLDEPIMVIYKD